MGAFSIWHWLIVLVVVLVLFGGKGKISGLMGDFGKGLNAFKKGVKEETNKDVAEAADPNKTIEANAAASDAGVEKDQAAKS